eukprot:239623-Alexandrium_andersonii.AAC.1
MIFRGNTPGGGRANSSTSAGAAAPRSAAGLAPASRPRSQLRAWPLLPSEGIPLRRPPGRRCPRPRPSPNLPNGWQETGPHRGAPLWGTPTSGAAPSRQVSKTPPPRRATSAAEGPSA